jgi:uncharacterized UBP type Zn finger protein
MSTRAVTIPSDLATFKLKKKPLLPTGPHKFIDFNNKIQRLKDMGVNEHEARAALSRYNWNLEAATEQLFS